MMLSSSCRRALLQSCSAKTFTRSSQSSTANSGFLSIYNKIKATGPITVADYMRECLLNPVWGYYSTRDDIIGSKGDFITSPEISQVFGELIGVWVLADLLVQTGKGCKCRIVELGPGRGALASDIIKVFQQLKEHCSSLEIHLVEASSKMAALQYSALTGINKSERCPTQVILENGVTVTWYRHLSQVPKEFSYYIAHEFFDALPVHQFRLTDAGWREILVDIESEKKLRFVQSSTPTPASVSYTKFLPKNSTVGEVSPETLTIIEELIERTDASNGAALIADYGNINNENKLTLRGFQNHKETDVLLQPGLADITADVNFNVIKNMVNSNKGVACHGPITQNKFLHNMGIRERVNALVNANTDDTVIDNLLKSYEMLTSPKLMGERFKFLSITSSHRHTPTPF